MAAYVAARWRAHTLHGTRLRAWQERRARALVDVVRARSPFHRERWDGLPSSAWRDFPVVDKAQMMAAFDTFTTVGVRRAEVMRLALDAEERRDFTASAGDCTVGLSSGTSGHRGLFLVSSAEQTRWAGTILARAIPDLRPGHRVAFFLRANSRLYERTGSLVRFRFFDLMQPLNAVIAALTAFAPQLIVAPPSLLGLLADARENGTLRANPSRLISVAEVLEPQDRSRLERVFQVPVSEVYQCTEGLIGVTCGQGAMHVQEDVMVVQSEAVAQGESSRITPILTDLWRYAQPIVRYRLGDVLQLDARPCACGSTWQRIAAIEGRQDDLCRFPQRDDSLRIVFPDVIRRMILLADARITEYRAHQEAPGTLHLQLEVSDPAAFGDVAARVEATAQATLHEYGCHATSLSVSHGIAPVPAGAKRRRVSSFVPGTPAVVPA